MKINITKKLGTVQYNFEVEHDKDIEALSLVGFLSSMPEKCKLCGSEKVHLASNKAKGYTFVKVLCENCNARSQLGQYKDGGFFWKAWEKYETPGVSNVRAPLPDDEPAPDEPPDYNY